MVNKSYKVKFFCGVFTLSVYSDDRENGKHKHFIDVFLFNKFRLINICYRTGTSSDGQDIYSGMITKSSIWSRLWRTCVFMPLDKIYQWITFDLLGLDIPSPFYDGYVLNFKKIHNDFYDYPQEVEYHHKDNAILPDVYTKTVGGTTIEVSLSGKELEDFKNYYNSIKVD